MDDTNLWPPLGVSVLIGPNGSGKTRALEAAKIPSFSPDGTDIWYPLRRTARCRPEVFAWIVETMRAAFPGMVRAVDVDNLNARSAGLWAPGRVQDDAGAWHDRSNGALDDGFRVLAGAAAHYYTPVAFRRFGEGWHPHAIRTIIKALRQHDKIIRTYAAISSIANDQGARIVLVTYSPVVLNAFADELDKVFVMKDGKVRQLTDLHDEAWLAQSKLGTLFERGAIAGPQGDG